MSPLTTICQGCGLPENGVEVRNVTMRPSGALMCADCAVESDRSTTHDPEPTADLDAVEQWMHDHGGHAHQEGGDASQEPPEPDAPF